MKMGWTGFESAGKSQLLAVYAEKVFFRNVAWLEKREKLGLKRVPRIMAFDTPMSQKFIDAVKAAGMEYLHFKSLRELYDLTEADIFMHEIYRWFPARGSESLNDDQRTFLSQAAKEGVDIYFCTQDFSLVHKGFRFLINNMMYVVKIMGSERPRRSAPPIKRIWGIVFYWDIDPKSFSGDDTTMQLMQVFPSWYFINRVDTELYDTSYKVKGIGLPPILMMEREVIYYDLEGKEVRRELRSDKL